MINEKLTFLTETVVNNLGFLRKGGSLIKSLVSHFPGIIPEVVVAIADSYLYFTKFGQEELNSIIDIEALDNFFDNDKVFNEGNGKQTEGYKKLKQFIEYSKRNSSDPHIQISSDERMKIGKLLQKIYYDINAPQLGDRLLFQFLFSMPFENEDWVPEGFRNVISSEVFSDSGETESLKRVFASLGGKIKKDSKDKQLIVSKLNDFNKVLAKKSEESKDFERTVVELFFDFYRFSDDSNIILSFENGFKWVEVGCEDQKAEGVRAKHCGMTHNPGEIMLSLRTPDNKPVVTATYNKKENNISEIKGRANTMPSKKVWKEIMALIDHLKCSTTESFLPNADGFDDDASSDAPPEEAVEFTKMISKYNKNNSINENNKKMLKEQQEENGDIEIVVKPEQEETGYQGLAEKDKLMNPQTTMKMKIRKTMDGNFIIDEHEDIDIVIYTGDKKVVAFPKKVMDDKVYGVQDEFFRYLAKKGIVDQKSIKSGDTYFSMMAKIVESSIKSVDPIQMATFIIAKWMDEERPYFEKAHDIVNSYKKDVAEPEEDETTPLGKVPQSAKKGVINPGFGQYGWTYNYSLIRENLLIFPKNNNK
jgi:hypothetical protein